MRHRPHSQAQFYHSSRFEYKLPIDMSNHYHTDWCSQPWTKQIPHGQPQRATGMRYIKTARATASDCLPSVSDSSSNPAVRPGTAGTHGHAMGWFTRCRVEFPTAPTQLQVYNNKYPLAKLIKNHTKLIQNSSYKPHKTRLPIHPPRTPRAAPAPPLAILRHGAARAAGGLP